MAIRSDLKLAIFFVGALVLATLQLASNVAAATVRWNPNPEADIAGYRLFWGETNAAPTVLPVGKTTQAQVTNLVAGRTYYFYLSAENTAGLESPPSPRVLYTEGSQSVPSAPANLAGVADSDTQIRVQWTDTSSNETGFRLMRKAGASGTYTTIPVAANTTSYTDTGLTAATQYFYKIHAYNGAGNSADSAEINVTTRSGPPPTGVGTEASFVDADGTTSGSWRGVYGLRGGFAYPYGNFTPPANVQISAYKNYPLIWAPTTTDPRALQKRTGTDRFAGAWHSTDDLTFYLRFTDTSAQQVSFYFVDYDRLGREQRLEFLDNDTGRLLGMETISNFENGHYTTWSLRGNIRVRLTRLAGPNCVLSAFFFDPPAAATATLVGTDRTTSGTWRGVYGTEGGFAYPYGSFAPPSYVQLSAYKNYPLTWTLSTTDTRALQKTSGADRFAAAWNSTNDLTFYLRFNDNLTREVSFYFLDFDGAGRQQRLEMFDDVTGKLLGSQTISNFESGVYSSWNLSGRVRVKLTRIAGPNCVMSAFFFDPAGPNSATFVAADSTTSGTWKGTYGSAGNAIAAETPALPAYASVTFTGASAWTWSTSTTDPAALQRPVQTGRIASTWYAQNQFSVDVEFDDGAAHELSFYFLDFDNLGRVQLVEVIDTDTGAALDSTELSNFRSGLWLSYVVNGRVTVRITSLGNRNAVLSGLFFD